MSERFAEVLRRIRKDVRAVDYRAWFKPLQLASWEGNVLCLQVRDREFQSWFTEHYERLLRDTAEEVAGQPVELQYRLLDPELFDYAARTTAAPVCELPPEFSFDTFVVGPSNHMAYAAGRAVSERPGKAYNPFFIYGGTGLGKTHLLYAIGRAAQQIDSRRRVLYVTSETYINDMFASIRTNSMERFRAKYRDACDILLVDDVQFLRGEGTQTQFFHTFNALHRDGKQIVFTSDRPPSEIPNIEERLRSRFEWGLIADINPPELETRVNILRTKADIMRLPIADEVAFYIAEQVRDNVRELESCLKILHLASDGGRFALSVRMAQEKLKVYLRNQARKIPVEQIQKAVAARFGISVDDLTSACRKQTMTRPRHVAMYLARKLSQLSFPEIGDKFGGRDHTSVMAGVRTVEKHIRIDSSLHQVVEDLEQRFKR
ncbi:MAG: chromosomal replication initiator protein DnaA [Deltaproteobacteria bacterium]|nr:chromosomal replication initiator protein DnaA [Deltaproteobacteria bacterium]